VPPYQVVLDKNTGSHRPSTAAFEDEELSVNIKSILHEHGLDWRFSLIGHDGYSLCSFTAAQAIELRQQVVKTPKAENPAHGDVVGRKTNGVRKGFTRVSVWVYRHGA
jgi:hypothetical protein